MYIGSYNFLFSSSFYPLFSKMHVLVWGYCSGTFYPINMNINLFCYHFSLKISKWYHVCSVFSLFILSFHIKDARLQGKGKQIEVWIWREITNIGPWFEHEEWRSFVFRIFIKPAKNDNKIQNNEVIKKLKCIKLRPSASTECLYYVSKLKKNRVK